VRTLTVLAGVVAGMASFGIGEKIYRIIQPGLVDQIAPRSGNHVMLPTFDTRVVADTSNASLAFGTLGFCLGGLLGLVGGLARRSTVAAIRAGLLGAVLGTAVGACASRALLPVFLRALNDYQVDNMLIPVLMHGLIWGLIGASAGLAFAVGLGERRLVGHALMAGLVGALLGSIAFDLVGGVLYVNDGTVKPISESWQTRLMARVMVTIGTAVALVLFVPALRDDVAKHHKPVGAG
jgi:hypothetical protein